jgi:hypothetical protein
LREKFNPRNINHMPPVKFFPRLDLDQIFLFLDGHCYQGLRRRFPGLGAVGCSRNCLMAGVF